MAAIPRNSSDLAGPRNSSECGFTSAQACVELSDGLVAPLAAGLGHSDVYRSVIATMGEAM